MGERIKATQVELTAVGLVLPGDFRLDSARIVLPNASFPLSPLRAPEGTKIETSIVVTALDIENYLNKKQPSGMSEFRVRAEEGVLRVVGVMRVVLPIEVGMEGRLEFSDGRLNFVPIRAEVAGGKAPDVLVAEQMKKINPLIDLTGLPIHTMVKSIEIGSGHIRLEATLSLTAEIPRRSP